MILEETKTWLKNNCQIQYEQTTDTWEVKKKKEKKILIVCIIYAAPQFYGSKTKTTIGIHRSHVHCFLHFTPVPEKRPLLSNHRIQMDSHHEARRHTHLHSAQLIPRKRCHGCLPESSNQKYNVTWPNCSSIHAANQPSSYHEHKYTYNTKI
jgi:hypothetical protein